MDDIPTMVRSISNLLLVLSYAADGCRSKQYCQEVVMESKISCRASL
jgi:hypothetical protein